MKKKVVQEDPVARLRKELRESILIEAYRACDEEAARHIEAGERRAASGASGCVNRIRRLIENGPRK